MLENYINSKGKAYIISLFSIMSLMILILSTQSSLILFNNGYPIIVGIGLTVLAIPFHILGRKSYTFYLISFLINSIANGFSVATYYIQKSIPLDFINMMLAVIPAVIVLFFTFLTLEKYLWRKKYSIIFTCIIIFGLLVTAIYFWIKTNESLYSFMFFSLLVALFYTGVFGISVNKAEREILRDISFGSFGVFIILTVVVLVILSEGDALSGLDLAITGDGKSKKKK